MGQDGSCLGNLFLTTDLTDVTDLDGSEKTLLASSINLGKVYLGFVLLRVIRFS